jgi:hypothetical protein
VAEWSCSGLQSRLRRFDSDPSLSQSNRDAGIQFVLFDPFILRYKDDPRFAAFCRKVGLPLPGEAPRKSA